MSVCFNFHLVHLRMLCKPFTLLPPEVITALHVARNKEDSNRNLQLLCKRKGMRIVIVVAIVKGQHQQCTLITPILSILGRSIQFFKSLFQVQHTVVTPQIEEMATQVSPSCTVVSEDNQAWPRALPPPARKFHQPAIVEACSNEHPYLPTHELLLHSNRHGYTPTGSLISVGNPPYRFTHTGWWITNASITRAIKFCMPGTTGL